MRCLGTFLFVVAHIFTTTLIAGTHWDICPVLENGRIATHGVTHALTVNPFTGQDTWPLAFSYFLPDVRVFGYELGGDPAFPTFAAHPGINNEPGDYVTESGLYKLDGTGLPRGSMLYLTIIDSLRIWTGIDLSAPPAGEYLLLAYGPHLRTVTTWSGGLAPLPLKTFTVNDHVHLHLSAVLCDAQGGINPTPGVYVVQAILESSAANVAPSLPFWLVYNFGMPEEVHEAAIHWINAHLVPEPTGLVMLGGLVGILLHRRET